jgi:hypothetical protein
MGSSRIFDFRIAGIRVAYIQAQMTPDQRTSAMTGATRGAVFGIACSAEVRDAGMQGCRVKCCHSKLMEPTTI